MKKNLLYIFVFVAVAVVTYFVFSKNRNSTIADREDTAFSVEDTAAVTRIVITEMNGRIAVLERGAIGGRWKLNGKYEARKDATDLLMYTLHHMRVRGPVSEAAQESVIRVMASGSKRVEIFQGEDQPVKTIYVGHTTQDHTGTYMLLETPEGGRSKTPFVMHIEGFTGFLNTRFFADELEWRYTGIFDYPELDYKAFRYIVPMMPEASFEVVYNGGNDIRLSSGYNGQTFTQPIAQFDTIKVKDLLVRLKKVHVESFNTLLKPEAQDSIRQTIPFVQLSIVDKNDQVKSINLFQKRAAKVHYDVYGNLMQYDLEYFWARTMDNEFALAQRFVFDPITYPLEYYLK
ncbi:MAG: hypothetical protein RLZZ262_364 [Bacteroidota bacterium]|jgi:hypothetical protein